MLAAMPGTYASFAAALIFYLLWLVLAEWACLVVLALALVLGLVTVALWPWASAHFKKRDPREVVLDEVVGQWVALAFIPLGANAASPLSLIAVAFFLFRGLDVAKPFPIRHIERLPRGWGVLLDDVAAGVCAGLGVWILAFVVHTLVGTKAAAALI